MTKGRFITFEGGEGGGKSTQIGRLADALRDLGKNVVTTREPGGAPGAEAIRKLLTEGEIDRWDGTAEALLHVAARRMHVGQTIRPALDRGDWVLSDRFADSTLAYQGYGHGESHAMIARLHQIAIGEFRPDLTLIMDLPVDVGLGRANARGGDEDRYERMDIAFHERLRAGYLEIAAANPDRCTVIDATADISAVAASIWRAVDRHFSDLNDIVAKTRG